MGRRFWIYFCAAGCAVFTGLYTVMNWCLYPAAIFLGLLLFLALAAEKDACHDGLTGLKNLRAYHQYKPKKGQITVFYFDLDGLKQTNDNQGHLAGDGLLFRFAVALRTGSWAEAVFRLGGDEFVAVCRGDQEEAVRRWEEVCRRVEVPSVTWGAASGSAEMLEELLLSAEHYMYEKRRNRGN